MSSAEEIEFDLAMLAHGVPIDLIGHAGTLISPDSDQAGEAGELPGGAP